MVQVILKTSFVMCISSSGRPPGPAGITLPAAHEAASLIHAQEIAKSAQMARTFFSGSVEGMTLKNKP